MPICTDQRIRPTGDPTERDAKSLVIAVPAQEPLADRRLRVGQHVFVRRQAIDHLGVDVGLHLRGLLPRAILDHRSEEPADHADAPADADQEEQPSKTSRMARTPSVRADSGVSDR
jgi:hypothetical protein